MERYISVLPEETPPVQKISDLDFEAIMAITHEDKQTIIDRTLDAWAEVPDYRRRLEAVMEGGPKQWDRLLHDDSAVVRMGLASKSTEPYQMALTGDPEPAVRDKLAQYGTNAVRMKLLEAGEKDMSVAVSIVKNGNAAVKKAAVNAFWAKPDLLVKVVPYAVSSDMERLIEHPERKIRVETALHGTRAMCEKVLKTSLSLKH